MRVVLLLALALVIEAAEAVDPSAEIDRLVTAGLDAGAPSPADDAAFVRRAHLAIIGRIPTHAQATAFLADTATDKRDRLVEALIRHPGRLHHEFTWLADLLRVETRLQNRYPGQAYIDWLKEQIRSNVHWDDLVTALITADGAALERGNGATGFYLRDAGMPLDHASMTVQELLGTRVGCAQCHDHPFDRWTRFEFYQMAAFTHDVGPQRALDGKQRKEVMKALASEPPEVRQTMRRIGESIGTSVGVAAGKRAKPLTLPDDWQYPGHAKGDAVVAHPPFGDASSVAAAGNARESYARWLTGPDNPRFALAMANRMWKRAFGRGLIEPVDDIKDETVPSNPELAAYLTRLLVEVDFDLARFQVILCSTDAWQRAAAAEPEPGEAWRGAAPYAVRLSAEQWWDSLVTLRLGAEADTKAGTNAEALHDFYDQHHDDGIDELIALARESASAAKEGKAIQGELRRLKQEAEQAPAGAARKKLRDDAKALMERRDALMEKSEVARLKGYGMKPGDQALRAAELPSPAPPAHPLRVFGQSDRQVIDNATRDGALTQALTLMNAVVDQQLLEGRSDLKRLIGGAASPAAAIESAYIAILSRPPRPGELATIRAHGEGRPGDEAAADVVWALLNAREFLFMP